MKTLYVRYCLIVKTKIKQYLIIVVQVRILLGENMDALDEKISKRIKEEIELSGKSKSDIAKAIGVSKPTVSQYLSGRIMPSLSTFAKLCNFLDCSADDILTTK